MGVLNVATSERETRAGLSGYDVEVYWRRLQREHDGIIGYELALPVRAVGGLAFNVRVWFRRRSADAAGNHHERGVSLPWPTSECRTITGLLFRLLIELDKKLSDEAHAAQRVTNDRLPGF